MDVTAAPTRAFQFPTVAISRPASFVEFFPTTTSNLSTATNGTIVGAIPDTHDWTLHVAATPVVWRQPAWVRVPTEGRRVTNFTGIVWKRVARASRYGLSQSLPASPTVSESDGRPIRCVRQRRRQVTPAGDIEFDEAVPSEAMVASLLMHAKVDVANAYLAAGSVNMLSTLDTTLRPTFLSDSTIQKKRSLYMAFDYGSFRIHCGNYFLRTFPKVVPIIAKASQKGQVQTDITTASIAEASEMLSRLRPVPRQRVAARGVPDLSDVKDMTEPDSPVLAKPTPPRAQGSSPNKRLSKAITPVKSTTSRRITDGLIKLIPRSTPQTGVSPAKPPSAASTPSPNGAKRLVSLTRPSPPSMTLHTAPDFQSPEPAQNGSTRIFRVPSSTGSCSDSPDSSPQQPTATQLSTGQISPAQMSPEQPSPATYMRPVAPTPSRWNRVEPISPYGGYTPAQITPGQANASVLYAAGTPSPVSRLSLPAVDGSSIDLDFGVVSKAFASHGWRNTSEEALESRRTKSVNKARRRQSEPFGKHHLKDRARRKSTSPQKPHHLDQRSRKSLPVASLSPLSYERRVGKKPERESMNTAVSDDSFVSETFPSPNPYLVDGNDTTSSDHTLAMARGIFAGNLPKLDHATPKARGVYNIDVRRNPDIFGTQQASSPTKPVSSTAVETLAKMAEDRCSGHAKVVVLQENGKLVVRFKLPTEYAAMFPESQGRDHSLFTTSPSVSQSPRINFNGDQLSTTDAVETLVLERPEDTLSSFSMSMAPGHTPVHRAQESPSKHSASIQKSTERAATETVVTGDRSDSTLPSFPNFEATEHTPTHLAQSSPGSHLEAIYEPREPESPLAKSSPAYLNNTLVISGFANSPSTHQSPVQRQSSFEITAVTPTPLQQEGLSSSLTELDATPSLPGPANSKLSLSPHSTPTRRDSSKGKQTEIAAEGPSATSALGICDEQSQAGLDLLANENFSMAESLPAQAAFSAVAEPTAISTVRNTPSPIPSTTPERFVQTTPSMPATENSTGATPTLVTSFTPVNQHLSGSPRGSHVKSPDALGPTHAERTTSPSVNGSTANSAARKAYPRHEDDSPNRDYMREFIRRTKPKKPSTTETGSPIAPPVKRLPLGTKSPNTASPNKSKRKLEAEGQDMQSPIKNATEPAAKKARRPKSTKQRPESKAGGEEEAGTITVAAAAEAANTADTVEDDAEMGGAPNARRSSRLRSQDVPAPAPKSSIPTAIKLGRSGAARSSGMKADGQTEKRDITTQTRTNTRKNKGNAEYPAQVLEKYSKKQPEEIPDRESSESSSDKAVKRVEWKSPLESHQEEKPKKGKSTAKRVTYGSSGIAKPAKTIPQRQRTAKLAETLGMAGNGTPAKPQRITRSRTRIDV